MKPGWLLFWAIVCGVCTILSTLLMLYHLGMSNYAGATFNLIWGTIDGGLAGYFLGEWKSSK